MKELFNTLSNVFEFFNEKKFIYLGTKSPEPAAAPESAHEMAGKGGAAEKGVKTMGEAENAAQKELNKPGAKLSVFEKKRNEAAKGYEKAGMLGVMGNPIETGASNPRRERMIAKLKSNPRFFAKLSKKITLELAVMGTQVADFEIDDTDAIHEMRDLRKDSLPRIAEAFNENDKTKAFFLGAVADLQLAKTKSERNVIYGQLAEELYRINPKTVATFLPSLSRPSTIFAGSGRREK